MVYGDEGGAWENSSLIKLIGRRVGMIGDRRGATSCGKGGLCDGRLAVEVEVEPGAMTCASRKVRGV